MQMTGSLFAALAVLAAAALSVQAYLPYGFETASGIALGAASIAAMSVTLILSTRPKFLEPFFGGLDQMYKVHKWLGISALALMIGHNTIEPELDHFVRETQLGEFASDLGEIALNGFIGLIMISWIKRIPFTKLEVPWPIWRFTHRFTGVLFAVAAFHQFAIDKPADTDGTLNLYLNALSLAGIAAWLFTQFVAPFLKRRSFVLDQIIRQGQVTELTLKPAGRPMRWKPGQFAFVSASETALGESHPFTIASAPAEDGRVRFAIKGLGRWTRQLPERLATGQRIRVEGPYGRFTFRRRAQRQIWLAGGIGITPFLAWADALSAENTQEIVLVWVVSTASEAFAIDRLSEIAARQPRFTFHLVTSDQDGRFSAQKLINLTPFPIRQADLFYCGPTGLRKTIVSELKALGEQPRRVHSEAFELR